jgi:dienelactone hydrolase
VSRTAVPARPSKGGNAKQALEELSRPGPHTPLRGDLGMVGIPGILFAPEQGLGLPAVVFGHDWLQPAERYADLLRHLATWGFVTAAPSNHRGLLPSAQGFAADLRTTLDVCVGVRLGDGRVSVDSRRTALAGHGIGAGAAMIAAAARPRLAAVVTIAAVQSHPGVIEAARTLTVPVLHLTAGRDAIAPAAGHVDQLAAAATGPVLQRTLPKAQHTGFLEGIHWSDLLLTGRPDGKTRKLTRALVTAFLLKHLCDEDRVDVLVDGKVPGTVLEDLGEGED